MRRIVFPLDKTTSASAAIAEAHLLLEVLGYPVPIAEKQQKVFGDATAKAVAQFQKERGLPVTSKIDEATANALNNLALDVDVIDELKGHSGLLQKVDSKLVGLASIDGKLSGLTSIDGKLSTLTGMDTKLGALAGMDSKLTKLAAMDLKLGLQGTQLGNIVTGIGALADAGRDRVVRGKVFLESGKPSAAVTVRAYHSDPGGKVVLGEAVTDADGGYAIRYRALPGVARPKLSVLAVDSQGQPLSDPAEKDMAADSETLDLKIPLAGKSASQHWMEGQIVLEHGSPAKGMKLRLYRKEFGGGATLLNEATTFSDGKYAVPYTQDGASVLEVRAVASTGEEVLLSKPLRTQGANGTGKVDLVAPGRLQPSDAEYLRLSADLTPRIGAMAKLASAREAGVQQDFSALNAVTGWDGRLIALAAMAERLGADPQVKLPQEGLYGLFRAGLPYDKARLAHVKPETVEKALKVARDAGIVSMTDQKIVDFKLAFAAAADNIRLAVPVPGARSTYGELLNATGLPPQERQKFGSLYLNHRGDPRQLWSEAAKAGLNDSQIARLKLHGKLAFLAGNSADLTTRLLGRKIKNAAGVSEDLRHPAQLITLDFHLPEKWKEEVRAAAGAGAANLDKAIPPAYSGKTPEERLDAYASDMARKVRLGFPGHVVASMVAKKEVAVSTATGNVVIKAVDEGFRFGETPVAAFLRSHPGVTAGMKGKDIRAARREIRTLQRVYQITPGPEAMPVLLALGMTSAYDVMAHPEEVFVALFEAKYQSIYNAPPPPAESRLVYRRASQVGSVTYNLFAAAKKMDGDPSGPVFSGAAAARKGARQDLVKRIPTMESLFGSMDFCECEHCRSLLSPAAYLVDLLQFIDPDPTQWSNKVAYWSQTHGGKAYPHVDAGGTALRPYDVLRSRRPDLAHIPLTCENTHTAMPYIDIVNEILEYYVAKGKLEQEAMHDTSGVTTAELLAEPQHVLTDAYWTLLGARHSLGLPFDLWLETVRQFCDYFETPLARVLEILCPAEDLFVPAKAFNRSCAIFESLRLSSAEVDLLSDPSILSSWHGLYGFPNAAQATAEATDNDGQRIDLHSAKALSRCLGVTYREIVDIVKTGFVNPDLASAQVVQKLGLSIGAAFAYVKRKAFYDLNKDLLDKASPLSAADQARLDLLLLTDRASLAADDKPVFAGLPAADLASGQTGYSILQESRAVEQKIAAFASQYGLQAKAVEDKLAAVPFDKILVLFDPETGCSFDLTILRHASARPADALAFVRINVFVRLWRKLGWSIQETDRALQVFLPKSAPFNADHIAKQPLKTALVYLAHLKALEQGVRAGKDGRMKLTTLWADIPATGENSLYSQLFLKGSFGEKTVFDHPFGEYLTNPVPKIQEHLPALQGALGLTAEEIGAILEDAGVALGASLSLPGVSVLYRHALLARAMKLSIPDFLVVKRISGIDPFAPLHDKPLTEPLPAGQSAISLDRPLLKTLEFVTVVDEIRQSGLKLGELDYLMRHRDSAGKYVPRESDVLALLKTLADGIAAIRSENAVPADPASVSDETLRQKLGLILPSEVADQFMGMWNGTVEFTAKLGAAEADHIDPKAVAGEASIRAVSYSKTRLEQTLVYRGVLSETGKSALKARVGAAANGIVPAALALLSSLLDEVQRQGRSYFEKHLQKQQGTPPDTGFLEIGQYDLLFDPDHPLGTGETPQARQKSRRAIFVQAFLPYLQDRLARQFVVNSVGAYAAAEGPLVESLIGDVRLLGSASLLDALASVARHGVDAAFFESAAPSANPIAAPPIVVSADTGLAGTNAAASVKSARFEGWLEVPASGAYRFYVHLEKKNAEAELRFQHLPQGLLLKGKATGDKFELGGQPADPYLELESGRLYPFTLEVKNLNGGAARLLVQGETVPKDAAGKLRLYPASAVRRAHSAIVLLQKVLSIVQGLELSETELRYLLVHRSDFGELNLGALPVVPVDGSDVARRFGEFRRLLAYARLRRDAGAADGALINVFEAASAGDANLSHERMARILGCNAVAVGAAVLALKLPPLVSEMPIARLIECLKLVNRIGLPVETLQSWAGIVQAETPLAERFKIVQATREPIRSRFEPEAWRQVAQPIHDRLRQKKRDALVAHVMQMHRFDASKPKFDRIEHLYEHFLIDPGMQSVVQTSRIRLAIASVQLFIQRCLLNMEMQVNPGMIDAAQWAWMKRYRVWEANRKIFLFPENWLEPEFRDDKTHLFSELEGALLQGDVSDDLAEDAFLGYLKKLDELARLEIVAMHMEDAAEPDQRNLHVIGRTFNMPHKHFYRRYRNRMWTPWEPIGAEIEGDHLAPIVWRDRLYLFWVTFMEKPHKNAAPSSDSSAKPLAQATVGQIFTTGAEAKKQIAAKLHWSEYLHGEWSAPVSGDFIEVKHESTPVVVNETFKLSAVTVRISKIYSKDGYESGVDVGLTDGAKFNFAFHLRGPNGVPAAAVNRISFRGPYSPAKLLPTRYSADGGTFSVALNEAILSQDVSESIVRTVPILKATGSHALLPCNADITLGIAELKNMDDAAAKAVEKGLPEIAALVKPVFYQDSANTFFIEPSVTERTIEDWQEWVTRTPVSEPAMDAQDWWGGIKVVAYRPLPDPDTWKAPFVPGSLINPVPNADWLVNPGTVLYFDSVLIGPKGRSDLDVVESKATKPGGKSLQVSPGSAVGAGYQVVLAEEASLEQVGLAQSAGGLNIVGAGGVNAALARNFSDVRTAGDRSAGSSFLR